MNTGRIKKGVAVIVIAAVMFLAVVDFIREFSANDTIKYFAEQPWRLLLVACVALIGGLAAFVFDRISLPARRRAKLITLGLAASFTTVFAAWCVFQSITILSWLYESQIVPASFDRWGIVSVFCVIPVFAAAGGILLWSTFCKTLKR